MKFTNSIPPSMRTFLVLLVIALQSVNGQFYKAPCREHSQCASNQFLQCLNGFCQCDSRSQTFDYKLRQCSTLAGSRCDVNNRVGPKCSRNSACVLATCECQPGYSVSSEFICKPNFQHQCKIPQDCEQDKGLTCLDGSCQCHNASLSYQGLFGCVDPTDPNFIELMTNLKRTETLLAENRIDLEEMLGDLDSSESQSSPIDQLLTAPSGQFQTRQLFEDSYSNTNTDLTGSSQNQAPQLGQGLAGLRNVFRGLTNSLGGLNGLRGLGGISQLFRNLGGQQAKPAGYAASGTPENQQPQRGNNLMSFFNQFLNLFNQILPVVRQFKMLLNPLRLIQRLFRNFRNLIPATNQAGGYGAPKPTSSYGPPASQTPAYGPPSLQPAVTGGYNTDPASSPGPAPQTQASQSQPISQAIVNQPYQTLPIQPQQQQQPSFQSFQTQSIQEHNFQTKPIQQQSTFDNPSSQFQNQQGFQNQNQFQNQQGFSNQNQQYQNVPQSQNFQNQNPIKDNQRPLINSQPVKQQQQVSNNEYPRQERFSYTNPNTDSNDDSSPYLPEHL